MMLHDVPQGNPIMPTYVIMLCIFSVVATALTIEGHKARKDGGDSTVFFVGVVLFAAIAFELITGIRL